MHAVVWCEELRERNHLGDTDVNWKIILKRIIKKSVGRVCTRLIWLGVGMNGGLI